MDKTWMYRSRLSDAYQKGVDMFLDFAFTNASYEDKIICPCIKCGLTLPVTRSVAYDHLVCDGFTKGYTKWVLHGEASSVATTGLDTHMQNGPQLNIDTHGLVHEAFGISNDDDRVDGDNPEDLGDKPNPQAEKFYKLIHDGQKELYPQCRNFTKLSFILQLFHIKNLGGWSNKSFTMLLELLKEAFPEGVTLPNTVYEVEQIVMELGLSYEKIHACPNDCMLYRNEHKTDSECYVCHTSRYVTEQNDSGNEASSKKGSYKTPSKVLHYFPLIPRLQRLFMSSKTASSMKWHKEGRTNDGCMRHPADSPAWMTFDHLHPDFAADCRNVRLRLACDGVNPFSTLSSTYSTWPVILIPYNLPPWMCMKQTNFLLSLIIPGRSAPGNNIDVYLEPLIDELKELWVDGVETYDASIKQNFQLRAALMWTISDFPAYAYLSGWSTKGKYACPLCHKDTCFQWLKHGRKHCYMGHRRFLDKHHAFRDDERSFDGTKEKRTGPNPLTGSMVLDMLHGFNITYGKMSTNPELPYNWKKRSIFFELPYWKDNLVRHNLDVMHIEKNVCESLLGTLLNLEGETKDNLNARLDLKLQGIRPELHPKENAANKTILPPSCFSLKKQEKDVFCKFLKTVKVPDGYAANISRCIDLKQRRIFGLKSHDCHILMQQLLPLAIRGMLSSHVTSPLIELSNFFRELCSKVGSAQDFMRLERQIPITLCKFEKIFPPNFFDIMVHLVVHLASEARLAGPVHYRWMYSVERYLSRLKSYVRNRSRPEGSMAKGYLANECLTFCSRYMEGVETRFNRMSRNYDEGGNGTEGLSIFSMPGRPLGKGVIDTMDDGTKEKAHRYVLFNCETVNKFIEQHRRLVSIQNPRLRDMAIDRIHSETFPTWFDKHVEELHNAGDSQITEELRCLAHGPNRIFTKYKRYLINGFRFHTKEIERKRKTQNSGIIVTAKTRSFASSRDGNPVCGDVTFYGVLTDIIELDYLFGKRVVLFKGEWVSQSGKRQDNDCTLVNFARLMKDAEPFVLASQAEQVMYVEDLKHKDWQVAIKINPRDFYDMNAGSSVDNVEAYLQSVVCNTQSGDGDNNFDLVRTDMSAAIVDAPLSQVLRDNNVHDDGDDDGNEEELDLM